MKNILFLALLIIFGCSSKDKYQVEGKWFTYTENGDYMELWIGAELGLTYLTSVGEFFLYDVKNSSKGLDFILRESNVVEEHEFKLEILEVQDNFFKTKFIGKSKTEPLKTYFKISSENVEISSTLRGNLSFEEEILDRMKGEEH